MNLTSLTRTSTRRPLMASLVVTTLLASGCTGYNHPDPGEIAAPLEGATGVPSVAATPGPKLVDAVFPKRPVFGMTLVDVDLTEVNLAKITNKVSCRPTIIQRFVAVPNGVSAKTLKSVGGTPLLSLEPWHPAQGAKQADFTLKDTINGNWDKQYLEVAQAVAEYHDVVLLRFAHEMNGDWYPWGVANGNTADDFIAAFRHVVDLFRGAGASNVLWVWSPNIVRGASSTQIKQFWPGPAYVDIVGLTGYAVRESNPDLTYMPTMKLAQEITDKPILLTEVGVQADASKHGWIAAFGQWLHSHPEVLGFVWFESARRDDWRFDDTAENLASFKASLATAGVSC